MRTVLQIAALTSALIGGVAPASASAAPTIERTCAVTHQPGAMACMALRRTSVDRSGAPGGYSPADLRSAYAVPSGGNGVTVAITDAYNDPHAESDLGTYRSQYGLPACTTANGCFRKVNQHGATSPLPGNDSSWAGEISLDLDMVSAICPACHILLIEASSNQDSDLFAAISRAVTMGAKFVSNSWGGDEESDQTTLDKQLDHPGVAITVSTGDNGYGTEYPATSRFVTAVGGTTLKRSSNSRGWSETAWSGAGSGCSAYDPKPVWQTVATGCSRRAASDVSAVADPNTGVAVYQTYGGGGWSIYGGTSAAAPIVASMFALAGSPGVADYAASYPYANASHFNDVTSGHNGSCGSRLCSALAGWDGPTGLGTPNGATAFAAPSACPAGNLIRNGGFEAGTAPPWTASTSMIATDTPHLGTHYARFDGTGHPRTDTLAQTVTIPASCTSATLHYWTRVSTAETTTEAVYDRLTVSAGGTVVGTKTNLDRGGYTETTVSLKTYIGKSVKILFSGSEDGILQTTFALDDVAVSVS